MVATAKPEPYKWLAQYFDEIFLPYRSPLERMRKQLLRFVVPRVKSACDLACGTGETALAFARRGIETFAVDLSPAMCRLASEKAVRARLPVRVIRADMRAFRLPHPVDLITCEYDAVNHIPVRSDLRKVVRAVSRALHPGGYFFFDVNNAQGFERYWRGNVWIEKPGVVLVMRNGHSKDLKHAWADVEWFVRERGGWQRHRERVEEICWTKDEVLETLRAAGFDRLRACDSAQFFCENPMVTRGCRTTYLARKAK